jgi:peptidoglycan/xylan/chitin deacetylase (PgdA/CDA1 family)
MGKTAQPMYREALRTFVFVLAGILFLFQSSCAEFKTAMEKAERKLRQANRPEKTLFQSEEYIVYRVRHGDSPSTLAERFLGDSNRSWVIEDANDDIAFKENQIIVIPLKPENKGGLKRDGYQVVPILSYHHFAENCKSNLCMPVRTFHQHLKYLKENGYRVITMGELVEFLRYRRAIPKKSVIITIDDGYSSAYHIAYPILKQYGFTATLFVYADYVGLSESSIDWDQLREMKANGFEVGSHTLSHADLTKKKDDETDQAYLERIRKELVASKQIIDQEIQQNTMFLAYPYGRYNETILKLSDQAGYKIGVTAKRGGNPFFADPLVLERSQILKTDIKGFVTMLRTFNEFSLN